MTRTATIELHPDALPFSAGHLMLLSESVRESLHGHDYKVGAVFHTQIGEQGLAVDLRVWREKILALCEQLDYHFIIPGRSAHLRIDDNSEKCTVHFNGESFTFLKKDVVILPVTNVTLEELSWWFLATLTADSESLQAQGITGMQIKIFNGRNESGASTWGNWTE